MPKQVLTTYKKDKINNVSVTHFTKQIIFNTEKAESDAIIIVTKTKSNGIPTKGYYSKSGLYCVVWNMFWWQQRVPRLFVSCSTPNYADKRMNGGNLVGDWCKLTPPSFYSALFIRQTLKQILPAPLHYPYLLIPIHYEISSTEYYESFQIRKEGLRGSDKAVDYQPNYEETH